MSSIYQKFVTCSNKNQSTFSTEFNQTFASFNEVYFDLMKYLQSLHHTYSIVEQLDDTNPYMFFVTNDYNLIDIQYQNYSYSYFFNNLIKNPQWFEYIMNRNSELIINNTLNILHEIPNEFLAQFANSTNSFLFGSEYETIIDIIWNYLTCLLHIITTSLTPKQLQSLLSHFPNESIYKDNVVQFETDLLEKAKLIVQNQYNKNKNNNDDSNSNNINNEYCNKLMKFLEKHQNNQIFNEVKEFIPFGNIQDFCNQDELHAMAESGNFDLNNIKNILKPEKIVEFEQQFKQKIHDVSLDKDKVANILNDIQSMQSDLTTEFPFFGDMINQLQSQGPDLNIQQLLGQIVSNITGMQGMAGMKGMKGMAGMTGMPNKVDVDEILKHFDNSID